MAKKKNKKGTLPPKLQAWVDARKRYRLSHAHVQMARELGMNPKKLGKLANHDQEPWKAPLPQFIEILYEKRFGRERPEVVISIEKRARALRARREAKKAAKRKAKADLEALAVHKAKADLAAKTDLGDSDRSKEHCEDDKSAPRAAARMEEPPTTVD